jgi:N-acetylneuraminic acid mutarotase
MTSLTRRGFVGSTLALGMAGPGAALPPAWSHRAALPVRTQEIYPAILDGQIYVAGGLSPDTGREGMGILDRAFRWSPDAWEEIAALPEPRHHPNLVGHDGAVYAIGGFRAGHGGAWNMIAANTRYGPASKTWHEAAPLPAPFAETCAVSLGGQIHVATGRQPAGEANANWPDHADSGAHFVFDAGENRWHRAAPNPNPRNSATGVVLNGRFHIVGGRRVNDGNRAHHEAYDPQSDSWHSLAPMPQGQGGLAAAVTGGRIYAFGGEYFGPDGGGVYPDVWIYDPDGDRWDSGPAMLTPRHGLGGVSLNGSVFAIAGATGPSAQGTSNRVEALVP